MSEQLRESLSAAVDGEADDFELRRAIDEASKDANLREVWERYHLVGAVLAGHTSDESLRDREALRDRIWDALDYEGGVAEAVEEDAELGAQSRGMPRWMGRAVGFAVALGAAVMIVVGSGTLDQAPTGGEVADLNVPEVAPTLVSDADVVRNDAYLLHHVQQTALNSNGVMSFVKVVTYDKEDAQ